MTIFSFLSFWLILIVISSFILKLLVIKGVSFILLGIVVIISIIKDYNGIKLKRKLKQSQDYFNSLTELTGGLKKASNLNKVLSTVLYVMIKHLKLEEIYFFLVEEDFNEIYLKCVACPSLISIKGISNFSIHLHDQKGIIFNSIKEKRHFLIKDALKEYRLESNILEIVKAKRLFILPVVMGNKVSGVFVIGDPYLKIKEQTIFLLGAFSNEVGVALENAYLYHRMEELSIIDELTNVQNYRFFKERLVKELELARRYAHFLSLAIIDIDNFKRYNDTYGHVLGDRLLMQLASIFKTNVRETDTVARYGGEEFTLILPATSKDGAIIITEKIRRAVESFEFDKGNITVSIGIATYPIDAKTDNQLITYADKALYIAKNKGKNRVVQYGVE